MTFSRNKKILFGSQTAHKLRHATEPLGEDWHLNGEFSVEIPFIFCPDEQKMWNDAERFRMAACGDRVNERMRIADLRCREAAARAVLRTAFLSLLS